MITPRQAQLLCQIVDTYIKTAEPVSSKLIEKRGFFDLSSATIRNDMSELESVGYISQLHTSGGRVPTAKAYRFYVDNIVNRSDLTPSFESQQRINDAIKSGEINPVEINKFIARTLSNLSGQAVITAIVGRDEFYKTGISQLLNFPEFREFNRLMDMTNFFDGFESMFDQLERQFFDRASVGIKVFIGRENKVGEIEDESVITAKYQLPRHFTGSLTLIGPMRMDYLKNTGLINYTIGQLNNLF
ncbi:MAG: hypothetical protein A2750_04005 [Candidatus Yanofskybacteria bacterium RIFCSPHIGHO2_01_FULL_45_42]|uniref:Heat-inducible transcription repressor HrcA n=3 Tax=Candidatus Yanofskyibacteriota TaxID=1752733 RepID=A0A1F8F1D0_9BACT|nr:MAG: hypothetical protein A2750_04005 [Candidatus Yanofskybacteria bacterium RIFCSPHIGHO2_01_FULL_45_42]OGN16044.1 MAG: hypothetical protein A3C81_01885 [Candidatus Yanofskybacteria bacterium RIFCSPHIGHO2_02_FULL_46_19]OGN26169.1 MAG: hypothetical protein A3B17_02330 [Candidatus Yanofskybacteria bacterium RIFCSPLOWO2_01_FULL_45_72]OGN32140.1 MAG: hypothetical protein A3J01_00915 [Candidatus Yanofskybacteria bacterium RIFCSPLOWO2_02_FULL_45_18]